MDQLGGGGVAGYGYNNGDIGPITDFSNSVPGENTGTMVTNARIVQPQMAYQEMQQGIQMFQQQASITNMQRNDSFSLGFSQGLPLQNLPNPDLNQMIVRMQQLPTNNMSLSNIVNYNDPLAFLIAGRQAATMTNFEHLSNFGAALPTVNSQNHFTQSFVSCNQQSASLPSTQTAEMDGSSLASLHMPSVNTMQMTPGIYQTYLGQTSNQALNAVLTNMQSMQTLLNIPQLRSGIVQTPQQIVNQATLSQFCNSQFQQPQTSLSQIGLETKGMQQDPVVLSQHNFNICDKNEPNMQGVTPENSTMIPNTVVHNTNPAFIVNPNNHIFQQQLFVIPNLSLQQGLSGGPITHPCNSLVGLGNPSEADLSNGNSEDQLATDCEQETVDSHHEQEEDDDESDTNTEVNSIVNNSSDEIDHELTDSSEIQNFENLSETKEEYSDEKPHITEKRSEQVDEMSFESILGVDVSISERATTPVCEEDSLEFSPSVASTPMQNSVQTVIGDSDKNVDVQLQSKPASCLSDGTVRKAQNLFSSPCQTVQFFFMGKLESKNTPSTITVVTNTLSETAIVENEVIEIISDNNEFLESAESEVIKNEDTDNTYGEKSNTAELKIKSENLEEYEDYLKSSNDKESESVKLSLDDVSLNSSVKKEESTCNSIKKQPLARRKLGVNKRKFGDMPLKIKSSIFKRNVDKVKEKYKDKIISEISSKLLNSDVPTKVPVYKNFKAVKTDQQSNVQSKPYAITSPSFNKSAAKAVMTTTVADNATIVTISILTLNKAAGHETKTKTLNINQVMDKESSVSDFQTSKGINDIASEYENDESLENATLGVERTPIMSRLKLSKKSIDQEDRLEVNIRIDDSQLITHGEQKRWQCNMCPKSYTTKHNLVTHILDHSGIKPHLCMVCGKYFKQLSHLNTHMLTHDNIKPHICQICGKGFTQISHLKRHQAVHLESKPYICDICGRGFAYPSELRAHKEKHIPGRDKCTDCGEEFSSVRLLRQHQLTHEHRDDLTCKVCTKVFRYPSQLRDHMASHGGARPFICTECGMDFMKEHHLKAHQFTHTGLKPYSCEYCSRSFNQKANMMRHMLIHNAERAFECDVCEKTFTQPQTLKAHKVVHAETKPFHCKFCGKQFGRLHNLQGHMHMHNNTKPCVCFCGSSFTLKGNLNRHKKVKHGLNESTESMEEDAVNFLSSLSSVRSHSVDSYESDMEDAETQDLNGSSASDPFSPRRYSERKGRKSVPRKHVKKYSNSARLNVVSPDDNSLENSIKQEMDHDDCTSKYFSSVPYKKHKRKREPVKHSITNEGDEEDEINGDLEQRLMLNDLDNNKNEHSDSDRDGIVREEVDSRGEASSSKKQRFDKGAKLDCIIAEKLQKS